MALAAAKLADEYYMVDPGIAADHANVAQGGSIAWTQAQIASTGVIELVPGTYTIGAGGLTIASGIQLVIRKGAILALTGNLTINGTLDAGLYQIFSGAGTVTFGDESVPFVPVQWRGIVGDDSTDNTANIELLIADIANNPKEVFLSDGIYKTQGMHIINFDNFNLRGESWNAEFKFDAQVSTNYLFWIRKNNYDLNQDTGWIRGTNLCNFKITSVGGSGDNGYGIYMIRAAQNAIIDNVRITGGRHGIYIAGCLETYMTRCYIDDTKLYNIYTTWNDKPAITTYGTTVTIERCTLRTSRGGGGIDANYTRTLRIINNVVESHYYMGIRLDGCRGCLIFANHLEGNNVAETATNGAIHLTSTNTGNDCWLTDILFNHISAIGVAAPFAIRVRNADDTRIIGNYLPGVGVISLKDATDVIDVWIAMNCKSTPGGGDTYSGSGLRVRTNDLGEMAGIPTPADWHPGEKVYDTANSRLYFVNQAGNAVKYASLDG